MNRIDAGAAAELPVGVMRCLELAGRKVVLYHTATGFFASDHACPHRGGPLVEGVLIGEEVTCPWHLWSFDVRTGLTDSAAGVSMTIHQVEVEGGRLLITLTPSALSSDLS